MTSKIITKLTKGKQYRFDWLDTYNFLGWRSEEEIEEKTLESVFQSTVGFFIKEFGDWYIVAMHCNPNNDLGFLEWGNIAYIPKKTVKKIKAIS